MFEGWNQRAQARMGRGRGTPIRGLGGGVDAAKSAYLKHIRMHHPGSEDLLAFAKRVETLRGDALYDAVFSERAELIKEIGGEYKALERAKQDGNIDGEHQLDYDIEELNTQITLLDALLGASSEKG